MKKQGFIIKYIIKIKNYIYINIYYRNQFIEQWIKNLYSKQVMVSI